MLCPRFVFLGLRQPNKTAMLRCAGRDLLKHRFEFFVPNETDNSSFGISPSQVTKNLVDGFVKVFVAFPKFALANKDVRPSMANKDVSFTVLVEGFPGRIRIMGLKHRQQMIPQILLPFPTVRTSKLIF